MRRTLRHFCTSEDGAVTVDWVVLTALLVGLAAAAFAGVEGGISGLVANIQAFLVNTAVGG